MKFGHVIEYNMRNIFLQISCRKIDRETSSRPLFCFFFSKALLEVKASGLQLSFNILRQSSIWHTIKTNCINIQAIDSEIWSIFIFQKRVSEQYLWRILCMIFQGKCFSCYTLLTDQISLSDCLFFSRYWSICVLKFLLTRL